MTTLVALALTSLFYMWKDKSKENEMVFNKKGILETIAAHVPSGSDVSTFSNEQVQSFFQDNIQKYVVNMKGEIQEGLDADEVDMKKEKKKPLEEQVLPLYVYNTEEGKKLYVLTVRGNGLWDEIWGCIALESDLNTVAGVVFDHTAETPGLGAEIKDNTKFKEQFKGTSLFNSEGEYVSVKVRKGTSTDGYTHEVDGISAATITCDGVTEMMKRGIAYYLPYFETINPDGNSSLPN